jgi:hypothetical protein
MHAAIPLFLFWTLAFVTLAVAVVLLNVYYGAIGNDLTLHSLGREAAIAGTASWVEGGSAWLVVTFVPSAAQAMLIPALIVVLIYKLSHFEDWSHYDVLLLLAFQVVVGYSGVSLFLGHFQTVIFVLGGFGLFLAIIAGLAKSL